ncbi:MAG TPA: glycosyltransferase family 39 protein [Acidimicrobiales bacterium]|nr:glycosyltransferase family 39 protein [Acidimicrobiales bacterium]
MITETPRPEATEREPAVAGPSRPAVVAVAVAAVVVAGLVLRFWTRSQLWLDEALTVNIARVPLHRLPTALRHDGAPPLYYAVLHLWMRAFGTSNVAVRSLSAVCSVACLPLMWLAGRRVGRSAGADPAVTGTVALVLLASSPFAIRYATEARMYSLVVLLTVIGYLALSRLLSSPSLHPVDVVGFGLVCGLLVLTQYWALYLVGVLALVLLWQAWRSVAPLRRERARVALVALAAGMVLFVPWLPTFYYQLRHTGTPWSGRSSFAAMVNAVSQFAGGSSSTGRALGLLFFALAGFGLFGLALDTHRVEIDLRTRPRGRALAIVVGGTLAVAVALGLISGGAFQARYAAVVFAPFLLLVVLGTTVFLDRRVLAGVVAVACVCGLATASGNVTSQRTQAGVLAGALRQQYRPGDLIAYCPDQLGPAVSRLLPASFTQVTFPRRTGPAFVDWVDYAKVNGAADPDAFARYLDARAGPSHAVWLVWAAEYRTFGAKCQEAADLLGTLRPPANQLIEEDPTNYYEHANLVRFPGK